MVEKVNTCAAGESYAHIPTRPFQNTDTHIHTHTLHLYYKNKH